MCIKVFLDSIIICFLGFHIGACSAKRNAPSPALSAKQHVAVALVAACMASAFRLAAHGFSASAGPWCDGGGRLS